MNADDLEGWYETARQHHKAGDLGQDKSLYEKIPGRAPEHPGSLNLLAALLGFASKSNTRDRSHLVHCIANVVSEPHGGHFCRSASTRRASIRGHA